MINDTTYIDKNTKWRSIDGRITRFCDMDADHLINIYHFLERFRDNKSIVMRVVIKDMLIKRGNTVEHIEKGILPYTDSDGDVVIWNENKGYPVPVIKEYSVEEAMDLLKNAINKRKEDRAVNGNEENLKVSTEYKWGMK